MAQQVTTANARIGPAIPDGASAFGRAFSSRKTACARVRAWLSFDVGQKMKHLPITVFFCLILATCGRWSIDSYWWSDGYSLNAIDVKSQMCLVFDGDSIALVGPTIFAVG